MPKLPRLTAREAERKLLAAGFVLMRSKGSHCIYFPTILRCRINAAFRSEADRRIYAAERGAKRNLTCAPIAKARPFQALRLAAGLVNCKRVVEDRIKFTVEKAFARHPAPTLDEARR